MIAQELIKRLERDVKNACLVKVPQDVYLGCMGTGSVVGKRPCGDCQMRGFVHHSTEREHDVGPGLRCFFCMNCVNCGGVGLEEIRKPKEASKRRLGANRDSLRVPL